MRRWCRSHNLFYGGARCRRCDARVVEEAGRLPLRVLVPQAHPRCHRCFNLIACDAIGNPICRCGGAIGVPDPLPSLSAGR